MVLIMVKMKYEIGDVILEHGLYGGIFEMLVKKYSKASWTHSAVVVSETEMIDSTENGVTIRKIPEYDPDNIGVFRYPRLTKEQKESIVVAAKSHIGKKYDWLQIVGLFIRLRFNKTFKFLFGKGKEAMICFELTAVIFEEAVIQLFNLSKSSDFVLGNDFVKYSRLERVDK